MIHYATDSVPESGTSEVIAPGVRWLRMPLPFALTHINLWLIDDDDDCVTIVDTGLTGGKTRGLWEQVLGELGTRPGRVIVTHMHPDHCGSAGWLCERYSVELWMTRSEYLMCRVLQADEPPPPETGTAFYHAAGFTPEQIRRYHEMFGGFGKAVDRPPDSYRRLQDGDTVQTRGASWKVICGYGHSPEHACLYNETANVFIAGDQLLPTISSNVSVWPTEPEADPLAEWLASCRRLRELLPEDVLVLPAHGKPFRGARQRLTHLIEEHERGLDELRALCAQPQLAVDVFPALFRAPIGEGNRIMATGEAIAHLNYLIGTGEIIASSDKHGRRWYQRR